METKSLDIGKVFGGNADVKAVKHPKCLGYRDEHTGEYDCEYQTAITCDECKYGVGRKDPDAKCNRI